LTDALYERDADMSQIRGRRVAVLGYGSQGHAQALNLSDSHCDVIVGLREGSPSRQKAMEAGLTVANPQQACRWANVIMVLVPDTSQPDLYETAIEPNLKPGDALLFAHGLCIHFERIAPPEGVDVCLIAPKGPGHLVRSAYVGGGGVPCLIGATDRSSPQALGLALAYACAIGGGRAGVIRTTFEEETVTDLFGEQTILCGGLLSLMQMAYETLVNAGYSKEVAYFECMHELKLIVDLMYMGGSSDMLYSISTTAAWGCLTTGPKLIGPEVRASMQEVLARIQGGSFTKGWFAEIEGGGAHFKALLDAARNHPSEAVGARLRGMMPFLGNNQAPIQAVSGGIG